MMLHTHESESTIQGQERRYDAETLRRVAEMAARLQHDQQESVTAREMEALGSEIGLQPEYIQQALSQVQAEQSKSEAATATISPQEEYVVGHVVERHRRIARAHTHERQSVRQRERLKRSAWTADFIAVSATMALPLCVGLLAYIFKSVTMPADYHLMQIAPRTAMMQLFTLVLPMPLALLQGFVAGRRRVGFLAAVTLMLALAPTVPFLGAASPSQYQEILVNTWSHFPEMFLYVLIGMPIAGALGVGGAWIRQQSFPKLFPINDQANGLGHEISETTEQATISSLSPTGQAARGSHLELDAVALHRSETEAHRHVRRGVDAISDTQKTHPTETKRKTATPGHNREQRDLESRTEPGHETTPEQSTFVSLDVASLIELRESGTGADVDYSFGQLRAWIELIVRRGGGELQPGEEGSLLIRFASETTAFQTVQRLYRELPAFNRSLNRLPHPFQLRSGISTGLSNSNEAIQRSYLLLKQASGGEMRIPEELGAVALAELGEIQRVSPEETAGSALLWTLNP